mgnify:CR=1 FL=1
MNDDFEKNDRGDLFSKPVRAGKRTYFFDVKSTRAADQYLTITESKKRFLGESEGFTFEKHKIFLYKEDFSKFMEAMTNIVNHVKNELMPEVDFAQFDQPRVGETPGLAMGESDLKWD